MLLLSLLLLIFLDINPIMVNNKPMVTDFGNKSYNNEMNPLRNNNTMVGNSLTSNNYKMNTNSFPKDSQLTPLRTQNKNQTTPIIIKRHSRVNYIFIIIT